MNFLALMILTQSDAIVNVRQGSHKIGQTEKYTFNH